MKLTAARALQGSARLFRLSRHPGRLERDIRQSKLVPFRPMRSAPGPHLCRQTRSKPCTSVVLSGELSRHAAHHPARPSWSTLQGPAAGSAALQVCLASMPTPDHLISNEPFVYTGYPRTLENSSLQWFDSESTACSALSSSPQSLNLMQRPRPSNRPPCFCSTGTWGGNLPNSAGQGRPRLG